MHEIMGEPKVGGLRERGSKTIWPSVYEQEWVDAEKGLMYVVISYIG